MFVSLNSGSEQSWPMRSRCSLINILNKFQLFYKVYHESFAQGETDVGIKTRKTSLVFAKSFLDWERTVEFADCDVLVKQVINALHAFR